VAVPTRKTVKKSLHLKQVEAEKTIKDLLVGNFFSLMLDHWTSAANVRYHRQCNKTTTLENMS